jgi:hypothetical protein
MPEVTISRAAHLVSVPVPPGGFGTLAEFADWMAQRPELSGCGNGDYIAYRLPARAGRLVR